MKKLRLGCLSLFIIVSILHAQDATNGASGNPSAVGTLDALIKACDDGDLAQVKTLIGQGVPMEGAVGNYGFTPLIEAASNGHLDILNYLIDQKASLDHADAEGSTPLLHACWMNHADCALALINAGAQVSLGSKAGRTPLMYASSKGNDAIVAALIARQVKLDANCNSGSAILWAAGNDHLSTVKLLAAAGANLTLLPANGGQADSYSLLAMAAAANDLDMIDYLLGLGVSVDSAGAKGTTPLMAAADGGNLDIVARLLDKGAQVNLQNGLGETALMQSANAGVMELLLQHGANPELKDPKGMTALMRVAVRGNTDDARALIERGADINATDPQGETALTLAGDRGEVEVVALLKDKGAKRTDVHVIPKGNPDQPLPPARAWALAVGQFYTQRFGANPLILGGGEEKGGAKTMLNRDWNVRDHSSLIRQLDEMRDAGHHAQYQMLGAQAAQMSDDQFNQFLSAHPEKAAEVKALRSSYLKWKDRSGAAWDICRASMLVNEGYAAGFIKEDEAWSRLNAIAQQAQSTFSSWQEMSDNFLDGREIWAKQRDPRFEAIAQLLLNPQDANSPWNQNPWKTDLGAFAAGQ